MHSNLCAVLQGTLEEANGHGSVLVRKDALQVRNAPFLMFLWLQLTSARLFNIARMKGKTLWATGMMELLWRQGRLTDRLSSFSLICDRCKWWQVLGHWYECSWDGVGPLKRGFLQVGRVHPSERWTKICHSTTIQLDIFQGI